MITKHFVLLSRTAVAILLGGLLTSCSSDDDPVSPTPTRPPAPVVAELPPVPVFGSLAPVGQAAEDTVTALLAGIDTPAVMYNALAPASSLAWTAAGACWRESDLASNLLYDACTTDDGWAWAITTDANAPLADGETDVTGRRGAFYAHGPPDEAVTWDWVATASRDSVAWSYAREGESVDLHWSRDGEGANLWLWTWPGETRVGYRLSTSRTVGWCETYAWSAGRWILRREIAWDGGHGRWLAFDAAGQEINREIW